jgi:HAD superfamily hydrolase (TIGR01509 family)
MSLLPAPRAVLFDMDGTLTRPNHDFAAIKDEMGLARDVAILEELSRIEGADPERATELRAILERHEREAAETAEPREGAAGVVAELHRRGLLTAVITRNTRRFALLTLERIGMVFDVVVCREDAAPKPSPEPLRLACRRLGTTPSASWMVGDFLYDIQAGQAAGCAATVLLSEPSQRPFEHEATFVVERLEELIRLLG